MSLRDSYFNGPNGLQQQMDSAFAAGMAYVGAGTADISTLDLGDRNGSNLSAGPATPGKYFTYATPSANYVMWFSVNSEIAPSVTGTLVQVTILSGDSSTQVATKIAAAMNAISGAPFSDVANANVVTMANSAVGVVILPVSAGTLGGTAVVAQVQTGVTSTGNYSALQIALANAAAAGQPDFKLLVQGTGTANSIYLRGRNGDNLYLRSFFAGILQAMAGEQVYDYQVGLELDISTMQGTNVIFHFNFGSQHHNKPHVRLEPLTGTSCNAAQTFNRNCSPYAY
jgi:hypothetical protein